MEGQEVMRKKPLEPDEQHDVCKVYHGKRIIVMKHAELEGKSGTSDQTRVRHSGRIVAMGNGIYDRQMQQRTPGQEDVWPPVAELSGTRVFEPRGVTSTTPYEPRSDTRPLASGHEWRQRHLHCDPVGNRAHLANKLVGQVCRDASARDEGCTRYVWHRAPWKGRLHRNLRWTTGRESLHQQPRVSSDVGFTGKLRTTTRF